MNSRLIKLLATFFCFSITTSAYGRRHSEPPPKCEPELTWQTTIDEPLDFCITLYPFDKTEVLSKKATDCLNTIISETAEELNNTNAPLFTVATKFKTPARIRRPQAEKGKAVWLAHKLKNAGANCDFKIELRETETEQAHEEIEIRISTD